MLLFITVTLLKVGLLRSTDITPLLHYYESIWLPMRPAEKLCIPSLCCLPSGSPSQAILIGSHRFRRYSLCTRCLSWPRRGHWVFTPILPQQWQVSSSLRAWPLVIIQVTRLKIVYLHYGSCTRCQRFNYWVTPITAWLASCRIGTYMVISFHITRLTRFILSHQRPQRRNLFFY